MFIPEDIIEQIRQRTDIVELISEVVDLKKRGANYIGLCPFHQEKTPSFTVSQEKSIYKCFGCGAKGNAISFMIDYHKMSYNEALKELARKAGIQIPEKREVKKAIEEISKRDLVLNALNAASIYYAKILNSTAGNIAKAYFSKRGFSIDTINKFELGYAPDSWDAVLKELNKKGFNEQILLEAGLVIKRDNGGYYDRFRGRAIFPIKNVMGKTIGFGARILVDAPDQPKYINSPQTIVYDKSQSLYG